MSFGTTPSCLVVGLGPVGRLFAQLLREGGGSVRGVAVDPAAGPDFACDIAEPTAELRHALAASDLVVLAVPERDALAAVPVVAHWTRPTTTVVDTLSVKQRYLDASGPLGPRPTLSLNPLFHPALGWRGNAVAACVVREGGLVPAVLERIEATGARVRRLAPEEHDPYLNTVQTATHAALHAFARTLAGAGLPAEALTCVPPPTRLLLALTARMLSASPDTYWDIQCSGATSTAARAGLAQGLADLDAWTARRDDTAFRHSLTELRAWYGPELRSLAAVAADALSTPALSTTPAPSTTPVLPTTPAPSTTPQESL
ncbi:prephenate dehydrogenase/arogenate dehydrogenase family protein [Streptomyces cyaneofuscatus]|uniref:prephenate dehydrogenase/arogenate dehydrogenase family protein n=1 Tax=Streptomyces cyaneofuscatus TaxID=66883 RepID=UPI003658F73B